MLWGQSFICFHNAKEESDAKFRGKEIGPDWPILKRWDVPWKWQTVLLIMASCGLSFVLTGLVEVALTPYLGFQIGELSLDEKAEVLFVDQAITTALVLGVVYGLTNTFQPLPDNLFCYMLKEPFNIQKGWLYGQELVLLVDAPVSLLPLIGSSNISTACLVGITGVLAPLLEETVFRGFFMASLTKWDCTGTFLCSNSQSSNPHQYTCSLEFRGDPSSHFSSAPRI
uniref:CAAX amino terminal protease family protein n=1 Tax=Nelumbo nucifera TaxID=4432 RepID=A0A822YGG8_NELNU|nr:TPA_asm: hypothetical protein HUJ06_010094 [Nelumbo nucifera]